MRFALILVATFLASFAARAQVLDPFSILIAGGIYFADRGILYEREIRICRNIDNYIKTCDESMQLTSQEIVDRIKRQKLTEYRRLNEFTTTSKWINYMGRDYRDRAKQSLVAYKGSVAHWQQCRDKLNQLADCEKRFVEKVQSQSWFAQFRERFRKKQPLLLPGPEKQPQAIEPGK